jgi:retron-type reverse transcriptase
MKRYGNLYPRVYCYDNLLEAYINARRGKVRTSEVKDFEKHLDANLLSIQKELRDKTYRTPEYTIFTIHEPKERIIYKLPFRDRVVHWALMLILEPIWVKIFSHDTYACIRGRGTHAALKKLRIDLKNNEAGTRYCLKLDIKKFYPSINHSILEAIVRRKIKDPDMLWVLDGVIRSVPERGVPIGNYISQFFANLYLAYFDHDVKADTGIRYYYRYADDMVFLAGSKDVLHGLLIYVNDYLNEKLDLKLKGNYQVYPVESRGIDFVGYVTYHTHSLARKKNKQGLCRQVAKLRKAGLNEEEIRLKTASRTGFMKHCNSNHLLYVIGMKKFSEIRKVQGRLDGPKLHIDAILDRPVRLTAYEVSTSKYRGECLTLQYLLEEDVRQPDGTVVKEWVKHISFTGSEALIKVFKETDPDDYPVMAKIIKQPIGDKGNCFYNVVDPDY